MRLDLAINKLNERLSELEDNKKKALNEKKVCSDIGRYRKLHESIVLMDKAIELNKSILKQERGIA